VDAAPWMEGEESLRTRDLLRSQSAGFSTIEEALAAVAKLHPRRPLPDIERLRRRLRAGEDGRLHWIWDSRIIDALASAQVTTRLADALRKIDVPTLCIRGSDSTIVTPDAAHQLQALIPNAEMREIAGAGHLVVSEDAEGFNAVLLEFLERRLPRAPVVYQAGSGARILRDALGCFATGITVVTTRAPDGSKVGLTANSFTSVSLDPPLILVCLALTAGSRAVLEAAEHFAINVLHIGQQPASARFARRDVDRFADTPHETWDSGVPILSNSLASFECSRHALYEGGDHVILIGKVLRAQFEPQRDPLLYFRGKYRRLHFS
jgi:flavin reductase (DIM6/NTAB) family NADH-FMN oxidoreductase RutF